MEEAIPSAYTNTPDLLDERGQTDAKRLDDRSRISLKKDDGDHRGKVKGGGKDQFVSAGSRFSPKEDAIEDIKTSSNQRLVCEPKNFEHAEVARKPRFIMYF
ncbi:hypothetical protein Trydic_g7527 [Trypoxylus dichotomus]